MHVQRKHPGKYNPLAEMKQKPPTFGNISQISQPQWHQFSNSGMRHSESFDPNITDEKLVNLENIIQEIRQLSQTEFNLLLIKMFDLLSFKN